MATVYYAKYKSANGKPVTEKIESKDSLPADLPSSITPFAVVSQEVSELTPVFSDKEEAMRQQQRELDARQLELAELAQAAADNEARLAAQRRQDAADLARYRRVESEGRVSEPGHDTRPDNNYGGYDSGPYSPYRG